MKQETLSNLQNDLKYLGFGQNTLLNQQLEEQVLKELREFELYTEEYFDDQTKIEAKLYFRKTEASERYFVYKFDALLRYSDDPDKDRAQTFKIYKGYGITFKEAFNLLQGRAVFKNNLDSGGEKYSAWFQLNFDKKDPENNYIVSKYYSGYGFDLEKALKNYSIQDLQKEDTKAALIRSLQRGNLQQVIMNKTNKTEKMFIEANPKNKTITIYSLATRAAKKHGPKHPPVTEEPAQPVTDPMKEEIPEEDADPVEEPRPAGYPGKREGSRPERLMWLCQKPRSQTGRINRSFSSSLRPVRLVAEI